MKQNSIHILLASKGPYCIGKRVLPVTFSKKESCLKITELLSRFRYKDGLLPYVQLKQGALLVAWLLLQQSAQESCSRGPRLEAEEGKLMVGCASSLVARCPVTGPVPSSQAEVLPSLYVVRISNEMRVSGGRKMHPTDGSD